LGIFQGLNARRGLSVLLVTHEREISAYARRLVTFRDGRLIGDTPVLWPREAASDLEQLRPEDGDAHTPQAA
jgi:putative ABC transport system ATP-binding protein